MFLKGFDGIKNVYFIGIGGISMSALAKFLSIHGYGVSGSDETCNEETEKLSVYGVKTYVGADGTRPALQTADLVVYTNAVSDTHVEKLAAERLKKRVISRGELLSLICENFSTVLTVAGSHGKTTCTAMCAHALRSIGVPFTAHIGGEDAALGNFYACGQEYLVTEACEYKKNMLRLRADTAVLLNVDKDHMECYGSEEGLVESFHTYCSNAKTAFVCADDTHYSAFKEFATFGIVSPLSDYRAVDLRAREECYSFTVEEYGKALCRLKLRAVGRCNVYNALAAFAAMRSLGFHEKEIAKGLENFTAVKRRFERVGSYRGASFICDYAHHPREILSTVATAKGICRGKLFVVFQPHTYSRTKLLLRDFVAAFAEIDELMIYKTYAARERYDEEGSARRLAQVSGSLYAENAYALKTWIKTTVREGDVVLFLGAGDIYYVAQYLLKALL